MDATFENTHRQTHAHKHTQIDLMLSVSGHTYLFEQVTQELCNPTACLKSTYKYELKDSQSLKIIFLILYFLP